MRILYDGFIYKLQQAGGIGRYFNNIISRLPGNFVPILTTSNSGSNIELPQNGNISMHNYKYFRPYRLSFVFEKPYFRVAENQSKYNLIHPTYYTLLSGRNLSKLKKPLVITIHDMIMELFKEQIDGADKHIKWKAGAIKAADKIICVSENTKNDLLRFFPNIENKISVIYEGSELEYAHSFGNEKVPDSPYFLYVGGRVVYKNFDLLLKSFSKIKDIRPGVKLCIVGAKLTDDENKKIAQLGLNGFIEHAGFVTSPHLAKLYRCSLALVYPSKYEGFGLPPLEAMTCRTAVIAANVSSVPEVVGNGGILIDPNSVTELTDAMLLLIDNQSARDKIIANGIDRSKLFSWDTNVNEIVKLYNKLV